MYYCWDIHTVLKKICSPTLQQTHHNQNQNIYCPSTSLQGNTSVLRYTVRNEINKRLKIFNVKCKREV